MALLRRGNKLLKRNGRLLVRGGASPEPEPSGETETIDGRVYKVVTIGDQTWLGENYLYQAGTGIGYIQTEKYNTYFRQLEIRSFRAPAGWHLPTKAEWDQLFDYVCGTGSSRDMMKLRDLMSVEDFYYETAKGNGNTRLNLQPGGYYSSYNGSRNGETNAEFWTSSTETLSQSSGPQQIFIQINTFYLQDGKDPTTQVQRWYDSRPNNQYYQTAYYLPIRLVKDD